MGGWLGSASSLARRRGIAVAGLTSALLLIVSARPLLADDAPMQETPQGLLPGVPGTTVRMADEQVDIDVTERNGDVHALVSASFDMFNRGPVVNLLVGFPLFSGEGALYFLAGGYADFDTARIADFHAASGSTTFQPAVRKVAFTSPDNVQFMGNWYVWEMPYPSNQTTNVRVTYDQTLNPKGGYFLSDYVLRTGALWDGTIGDATVTMSTSTGGFLSGNNATSVATNHVVWHLTDVKPTFDPSAVYVPAERWQRFSSAQARLSAATPSAADYAAATEAFLDILGRIDAIGGLPAAIHTQIPQGFVDRYGQALDWAEQATTLDPANSAAFEALGDIDYVLEVPNGLMLRCRPTVAPIALQKAVDLGSSTAQAKLDGLNALISDRLEIGVDLPDCSAGQATAGPPRTGVAAQPVSEGSSSAPGASSLVGVPDTLTDSVRADVLAAVDRANAAWAAASQSLDPAGLSNAVAGQELSDDLAELDQLRGQGQTKKPVNAAFSVTDVALAGPGHVVVRTHETWYAEIYSAADGRLLQRTAPATYDETYTVEYQNGGWIVTKNDLA